MSCRVTISNIEGPCCVFVVSLNSLNVLFGNNSTYFCNSKIGQADRRSKLAI